jgi:hypothetical protein
MFKKNTGVWVKTDLPVGSTGENYTQAIVCDGNGDRKKEIIVSSLDNYIYQFKGLGSAWEKQQVGTCDAQALSLNYGDGDNDGKVEIYAGAANGKIFQFKNVEGAWQKINSCTASAAIPSLVVGDGNGDEQEEVYAASYDHTIYQFRYSGGVWVKTVVQTGVDKMHGVTLGDGNNDGQIEVYSSNENGEICQNKWMAINWQETPVHSFPVGIKAYDLVVGDADNDGVNELYAAGSDGCVYQFKYENGSWSQMGLGSASSALYRLCIGDADKDNRLEIYAATGDDSIYQFKAISSFSLTASPTTITSPSQIDFDKQMRVFHSQINPNQGEKARVRWYQPNDAPVTLMVFNMLGNKVAVLAENRVFAKDQFHEILWDGKINSGATAGSGIYTIVLQSGDYKARTKAAVVK